MVSCDDCQEWFHISIHVQYDGVLFDIGNGIALTGQGILIYTI